MPDLTQPLEPLTPRQRAVFRALALFCAATRFLAMARSLWDWDEALFCLGMRAYDVSQHHPHPPGFPVYIGVAKLFRLFVHDDFRALQAVNLAAGVLLFPAVFLLARELRLRVETAAIAAAFCAVFPNVWFYGGTAFSDIPSLVLVVFSAAMLFRGCRDSRAYLIGTLLLALAIGIRPQNILVGIFPGLLASWYRARARPRDVVLAALIGIAVTAAAFGAAIAATGSLDSYVSTIRAHSEYISRVDSWRSPARPALWRMSDRFFLKQYQAPPLNVVMTLLVLVSVVGSIRSRDRRIGWIALTFLPFAIAAWLVLDRYSINRFSIGYAPLFAILGANGIDRLTARRRSVEPWIAGAVVAAFFVWTLPALNTARREVAPSVAAVKAAQKMINPARDELLVGFPMTPFVDYFAPAMRYHKVMDERAMPLAATDRKPYLLTEIDRTRPYGLIFRREQGHLWKIARRHYFVVAIEPLPAVPRFPSGWYPPEEGRNEQWRWMAGHSVTLLPGASGEMFLRLAFDVPSEIVPRRPTITVKLNGAVVDRFEAVTSTNAKDYRVQAAPQGALNRLDLEVDPTLNPAKEHMGDDPRDLGLLVRWLSWGTP